MHHPHKPSLLYLRRPASNHFRKPSSTNPCLRWKLLRPSGRSGEHLTTLRTARASRHRFSPPTACRVGIPRIRRHPEYGERCKVCGRGSHRYEGPSGHHQYSRCLRHGGQPAQLSSRMSRTVQGRKRRRSRNGDGLVHYGEDRHSLHERGNRRLKGHRMARNNSLTMSWLRCIIPPSHCDNLCSGHLLCMYC